MKAFSSSAFKKFVSFRGSIFETLNFNNKESILDVVCGGSKINSTVVYTNFVVSTSHYISDVSFPFVYFRYKLKC